MKTDREFQLRRMAWNDTFYPICCLTFGGIQLLALLTSWHWYQNPNTEELHWGYPLLTGAALAGAAVSYLLDRCLHRWERPRRVARFTQLLLCLAWASLFSAVELRQGHETHVFTQVLMFLSAGFRLPTRLHCGINTVAYAVSVSLLRFLAPDTDAFLSGVANNAIYLAISCGIIVSSNRFQYMAYRADQERARTRSAQLDVMAEQVEKVHDILEQSRVLRHDLRHYAATVEWSLNHGEYQAIRDLTREFTQNLDHLSAGQPIRNFTGLADIDAALSLCMEWADREGIGFQVELPLPKEMKPREFSLLLMNALENACQAVLRQPSGDERYIKFLGAAYQGQYYLEIVNTCLPGSVVINRATGLPVSGEAGHGYGVRSMATILSQYHAQYRFQVEGAEFRFQMIVPTGDGLSGDESKGM